jgi:hypothetical protein
MISLFRFGGAAHPLLTDQATSARHRSLVAARAMRELPFKNLPSVLILKPFSVWFSKAQASTQRFPVLPSFLSFRLFIHNQKQYRIHHSKALQHDDTVFMLQLRSST